MGIADTIAGEWIADADLHHATNVYGRRFWAKGNIEGEFYGTWPTKDGLRPDGLFWHFPAAKKGG